MIPSPQLDWREINYPFYIDGNVLKLLLESKIWLRSLIETDYL
jgi:hypothetical protein